MPSIPQPLAFDSAEIDYSGVELVLRFRRPVPTNYSRNAQPLRCVEGARRRAAALQLG